MNDSTISVRDAKARLSQLIENAEQDQEIVITRHGKPAARLGPVHYARKPVDLERLRALTNRVAQQPEDAGRTLRRLRDKARY